MFSEVLTVVLSTEYSFDATDPRDVIYGLLGVVRTWHSGQIRISPDYSLDCSTVYTYATLALLQHGWIRAFRLAVSQKSRDDLPSWVPNFSERTAPVVLAKAPPDIDSCTYFPTHSMFNERHTLLIEGVIYGKIYCNGLRRIAKPDIDDRFVLYDLLHFADRELIHTYFSGMIKQYRVRFGSE